MFGDRVFQAVQVTSVRRALTLFYKGHVRAVDGDYRTYAFDDWWEIPVQPDDHYISTPTRNILVPHVVQLLSFDRLPRQEVKFSRGNIYLRRMLIHGARAVLFRVKYDTAGLGQWVRRLSQRAPRNKVVVAIANKLARITWSVLRNETPFDRHAVTAI